ncbi:MAG: glycosyltransferase family 4 protein [Pseudomonadota bacterium]|nr:glycosyltransferase family 4 protein [Pseudomonadota bacterium]
MTVSAAFAIPGDLATPTGGYEYDRRLMAAGPAQGLHLTHLPLAGGYPRPTAAEAAAGLAAMAAAPGPVLADGLALGALPADAIPEGLAPRLVALCHHPLGLETGLEDAEAARMLSAEAAVLARCASVVVTSTETARILRDRLSVPPGRIAVAPPGIDPAPLAPRRGGREGRPPLILGVGAISARKDWGTLVDALARIADRAWTCVIAGDAERDPSTARALAVRIAETGLGPRIRLAGALDRAEIDALYLDADLFALPSRYEGYGMVIAEAMMRGLPVAACEAVAEVAGGAARLVPAGDDAALAGALAAILDDAAEADRMAAASRARALALPGWDRTARVVAGALEGLA